MRKSPRPYLIHIRQALAAIDAYRPATKEELTPQSMAWDAILMRLHAIGEYLARLRHLDEEAFAATADPSWHKAIGLRNVISHEYEGVDPDTLWQILTDDLPPFAKSIDAALDQLGDDLSGSPPADPA